MQELSTRSRSILQQLAEREELLGLELVIWSNGELKRGSVFARLATLVDCGLVSTRNDVGGTARFCITERGAQRLAATAPPGAGWYSWP
jgi:hypothetical protein